MNRRRTSRSPRHGAGFTLLSVLVSVFIMGIGLLGMVRAMVGVTSAATQNQTVSSIAALSNSFWGVVQWTPQATVTSTFPGTYDLSQSQSGAPTNLRPWLATAATALPSGTVTIAVSSGSCTTNCTVTMTVSWLQLGSPNATSSAASRTRTQTFYYAL